MTPSQEAKAVITASYLLYFIDNMCGVEMRMDSKTIKLKRRLFDRTRHKKYRRLILLSNKGWQDMVDQFKDQHLRVVVHDFIEYLAFNEEDSLTAMYGDDILDLISDVTIKYSGEADKEILAESRKICKGLTDITKKLVFDLRETLHVG